MPAPRLLRNLVALHALLFALVNAGLYAWWWREGASGDYWPLPVHLIWGAALVMHWANDLIQRTHRVR